ncbi:MAG: dihydrodipicolinate synthase family protein [Chloroflexi bacterium]|nr:dihydrodipicolinate synthase family protein [Chloroflexota bacterium]
MSELKAWARETFKGVQNLLFPSFTPDLSELDEEGIRLDVRQTIAHGFFATELTTQAGLTFDEAKRFLEIVVDEAGDDLMVSPGIIFDSLEKNIAFLEHAEAVGADFALLSYPSNYYPQSPEDITEVTRAMCQATDLPLVLYPSQKYNFGRFHPSGFPFDVIDALIEIDNVVSILVAITEPGFIFEAFRRYNNEVLVQVPWERWVPLLVTTYGQQWMGPGAYELFQSPEKRYLVDYFNLLLEGRVDEAMELYWRITPARLTFEGQFMPTQTLGTYHWPLQKYYQWLVGGNGGYTREPVMKLAQHTMEEARRAVQALGITPRDNDEEFFVGRAAYARAHS